MTNSSNNGASSLGAAVTIGVWVLGASSLGAAVTTDAAALGAAVMIGVRRYNDAASYIADIKLWSLFFTLSQYAKIGAPKIVTRL